jgi:hypothetical protein
MQTDKGVLRQAAKAVERMIRAASRFSHVYFV